MADELHGHHLIRLLQSNLRRAAPTQDWLTVSAILRLRVREALAACAGIWSDQRGGQQADAADMAKTLSSG